MTPVITPADRSNSPPIISSPTGTATIPKNAACCVQAARPVCLSHRWLALESVIANRMNTAIAPISAPSSGRRRMRVSQLIGTSRSSEAAGAGGIGPAGCEVALIPQGSVMVGSTQSSPAAIAAETLLMFVLSTTSGPLATVVPPPTLLPSCLL